MLVLINIMNNSPLVIAALIVHWLSTKKDNHVINTCVSAATQYGLRQLDCNKYHHHADRYGSYSIRVTGVIVSDSDLSGPISSEVVLCRKVADVIFVTQKCVIDHGGYLINVDISAVMKDGFESAFAHSAKFIADGYST